MKEALDAVPCRTSGAGGSVLVPDVWCEPRYVVAVRADGSPAPRHGRP